MENLDIYKARYLADRCQFILFTPEGKLVQTCNTLLDLNGYLNQSIFSVFPFLESLQDTLALLEPGQSPLEFPRLENFVSGIDTSFKVLDCRIECILNNQVPTLLLVIEHHPDAYQYIFQIQQEGKESAIQKELLAVQNRSIELEKELLQLKNEELKRIEQFKSNFFAEISHELRTPLNGIIGLTDLLLEVMTNPHHADYLKAIQSSGNHLVTIVNDVLDMSKIESGQMQFEETHINLPEMLQNIVLSFKQKFMQKGIQVNTVLAADVPEEVLGDKVRLTQILYNLVGNAIKFTSEGEVSVEIKFADLVPASDQAEQIQLDFIVKDSGIGIKKERLQQIFEPYQQASEQTTRLYGGTGLGLSIVRQLIELQGGRISVSSRWGEGTIFNFVLPLKLAPEIEPLTNSPDFRHSILTPFDVPLKVLLADDNDVNLLFARQILQEWNCKVTTVSNGKEAVELLKEGEAKEAFDLVLMDVYMPEMAGTEATHYIRKVLQISPDQLPIIALTASVSQQERNEGVLDLMDDYLIKPFKKEDLYAKIVQMTQITKSETYIDMSYLEEVSIGDSSFILDIAELFIHQTCIDIDKVRALMTAQNWEDMALAVHKVKPTFKLLGIKPAEKNLEKLQNYAKQTINIDQLPTLLQEVEDIYQLAVAELKQKLSLSE
ncbi:ATP-binding protein [uncultured Microscilla sp.]|uniref:ATP-binding protein n=1 Tax=uncultured Microscilla sp. TaxID=432653 RepID=UPI0026349B1B|nr:ATP-binding protein [uncultured Microscilla sp.]